MLDREYSVESLVLAASIVIASVLNLPFWSAALHGRSWIEPASWRLALGLFVLLVAVHFVLIGAVATRRSVRWLVALLTVAGALASFFVQHFGIVLDPSMMRNVLHTDVREAGELLGLRFFGVLAAAIAGVAVLWKIRLAQRPLWRALSIRGAALASAVLVAAGTLLVAYQDLSSMMRNRRELRYMIAPINAAWSTARVLLVDVENAGEQSEPPASVTRTSSTESGGKPLLFVMVIGETARAANFSLNGYARKTNPELAQLDVINFPHTVACGTSTEVSLPCMFSRFGRADYDEHRIRRSESALHLLSRAGVRVVWLDNQSGCKGVCDGLESHDLSREQLSEICADGRCFDEVLLHGLRSVAGQPAGDVVVVMHQLGNHGPAYSRRYPPEFRRFEPACESNELADCTREQIVNAYDNALLYTDSVLARTIRYLDSLRASYDVAFVYVSDHGESLGEHGLYLHGLPYAIAPREQKEVPMLWWFGQDAAAHLNLDLACLRRRTLEPASHDNLFHSALGLLSVETESYRPERDLLAGCRSVAVANADAARSAATR